MMTLYVKTGCPWCKKVLDYADAHGIVFEQLNIADPKVAEELVKRGGKRQVPYLVDGNIEMYESADIVAYLAGNGGAEKMPDPVQKSGGTCALE